MDILCKFMHETQLFVETADLPLKGKKKQTTKQKLKTLLSFENP